MQSLPSVLMNGARLFDFVGETTSADIADIVMHQHPILFDSGELEDSMKNIR